MSLHIAKDKEINLLHSESQKMFRRLIESIQVGIYMADANGVLFYVNDALVQMMGYANKDEVLGLSLAEELYLNPEQREVFLKKMSETGFVRDYVVKNVRKDGSIIILSTTTHYIRNDQGKIIGFEGIVHDVTGNKKLENSLMTEKLKLEEILTFGEKVNVIKDFDQLINFAVEKVTKILEARKCSLMLINEYTDQLTIQAAKGISDEVIKGTKIELGEPIAGVVAQERKPLLVKNIEYEKRFRRANRPEYLTRSFLSVPVTLEEKLIGVINVADKQSRFSLDADKPYVKNREQEFNDTDLKILSAIAREFAIAIENVKVYKELKHLTITDPLTRIYNYRHFSKSLDYEVKRNHRVSGDLSVMMIDVDDFKEYNDSYGHLEGDVLLKEIGRILKTNLRETDIVCRYAGDEFSVILPNTNAYGAQHAALKVKKAAEDFKFRQPVTLSVGISHCYDGLSSHELIQRADQALYEAKNDGKSQICVYKEG